MSVITGLWLPAGNHWPVTPRSDKQYELETQIGRSAPHIIIQHRGISDDRFKEKPTVGESCMSAEITKRRLTADAIWSTAGVAVSAICAAAYIILVGNCWGSAGLGLFSLALTVYTVASMLCGIGVHQAALYEVAARPQDPASASKFAWTAVSAALILGAGSAALGYLLAPLSAVVFEEGALPAMLRIFAFTLPLFLVNKTTFAILNAHRRMSILAAAEALRSGVIIGYLVLLAVQGGAIETSPYAFLLAESLVLILLGVVCVRVQPPVRPSMMCLRPLLSFGSKAALADAVGDLNTRLDVLVIGLFRDASAVGVYALASAFAKGLWLVPAALQRVTHPLFVQLHSTGQKEKFHRTMDVLLSLGAAAFIVLGLAAAVFGRPVIGLIYPGRPEMLEAAGPLYFLLPGAVAYAIVTLVGTAPSSGIGRPGNVVRIVLLILGVNLVLNFALVPRYAGSGAAAATTISLLVGFMYNARLLRSQVGYLLPGGRYGVVLLAFALVLIAVYFLEHTLPAGLLFLGGEFVLLTVLLVLRLLKLADLRELIAILKPAPNSAKAN